MKERTNICSHGMRYCFDVYRAIHCIISRRTKGKFQKCRNRLGIPPWTEAIESFVTHSSRRSWRPLPLFVLLSSTIRSWAHDVESLRKHIVRLIHRTKIVCAPHRNIFLLLLWFKRREMSIKWFRTSTLRPRVSRTHVAPWITFMHRAFE